MINAYRLFLNGSRIQAYGIRNDKGLSLIAIGRDIVKSAWYDMQQMQICTLEACARQASHSKLRLLWNTTLPFNIASYALLLMMICEVTGKKPGRLIGNFGCTHIYKNHIDALRMQLERQPYKLPTMIIKHRDNIDDFVYEDFELVNYVCHPHIKMEVSV